MAEAVSVNIAAILRPRWRNREGPRLQALLPAARAGCLHLDFQSG